MLELNGKKLAYQHPDLKQLESKKEAAYFLHRQVSLPWIQRAALEGIQAGFIAMLIQWRSVLTKRQTESLTTNFWNQFGITRGVKLCSLNLLEKAGLIKLSMASCNSLRIDLLQNPTKKNSINLTVGGGDHPTPMLLFLTSTNRFFPGQLLLQRNIWKYMRDA